MQVNGEDNTVLICDVTESLILSQRLVEGGIREDYSVRTAGEKWGGGGGGGEVGEWWGRSRRVVGEKWGSGGGEVGEWWGRSRRVVWGEVGEWWGRSRGVVGEK